MNFVYSHQHFDEIHLSIISRNEFNTFN